jgi:hypothetical protein
VSVKMDTTWMEVSACLVDSNVTLVKMMLDTVEIVLILELTLQLVMNVHTDYLMMIYMLNVKFVKTLIINVTIVINGNVMNVKSTEIYLTVLVLLDTLKLKVNVYLVLTTVKLVLVLLITVSLVLKQESMLMFVTVHTDYMMMVLKIHNVKYVIRDVLDVMDLISTVLFVPLIEKFHLDVIVLLV